MSIFSHRVDGPEFVGVFSEIIRDFNAGDYDQVRKEDRHLHNVFLKTVLRVDISHYFRKELFGEGKKNCVYRQTFPRPKFDIEIHGGYLDIIIKYHHHEEEIIFRAIKGQISRSDDNGRAVFLIQDDRIKMRMYVRK